MRHELAIILMHRCRTFSFQRPVVRDSRTASGDELVSKIHCNTEVNGCILILVIN